VAADRGGGPRTAGRGPRAQAQAQAAGRILGRMSVTVENRPAQNQYALVEDGETIGFAAYDVAGDEIRFTHTEIEPSRRRAGLGAQLVQGALDDVRAESDRRVVPLCPFVVEWIDEHVDYQELLRRQP